MSDLQYQANVCSFSVGLDELTRKQQRSYSTVLQVLANTKRFSVFEATANEDIANTMTSLEKVGYIVTTPVQYPWLSVELTDKGKQFLEGKL